MVEFALKVTIVIFITVIIIAPVKIFTEAAASVASTVAMALSWDKSLQQVALPTLPRHILPRSMPTRPIPMSPKPHALNWLQPDTIRIRNLILESRCIGQTIRPISHCLSLRDWRSNCLSLHLWSLMQRCFALDVRQSFVTAWRQLQHRPSLSAWLLSWDCETLCIYGFVTSDTLWYTGFKVRQLRP